VYAVRVGTSRVLCCVWFSAGAFIGCRLRVPDSRADQHAGKHLEHRFTFGRLAHLCIFASSPRRIPFTPSPILCPLLHVMPWMCHPRGRVSLLSLLLFSY